MVTDETLEMFCNHSNVYPIKWHCMRYLVNKILKPVLVCRQYQTDTTWQTKQLRFNSFDWLLNKPLYLTVFFSYGETIFLKEVNVASLNATLVFLVDITQHQLSDKFNYYSMIQDLESAFFLSTLVSFGTLDLLPTTYKLCPR